ncbi:MAG: PIG-L deacetylase family protein, partial [Acidimicrobiales bacterium]
MSTLVCFHAHPDDEALSTGGLMAKAAAAGHRVVLVMATKGEQGEPQPGVLDPGEKLWQRRMIELAESAELLGAEPPRYLEYEDSGMMGELTNKNEACFWQADVEEAAQRLAAILTEV